MLIGGSHDWLYPNGHWHETKVSPDKWEFSFKSMKCREYVAGNNTGAAKGTTFHWFIIADQMATKLDSDSYSTIMKGFKFKIGHKRPYWKKFSYDYQEQQSYRDNVKQVLEEILLDVNTKNGQGNETSFVKRKEVK